ncbi:uracil phosphoribosyltransferase [Algoriphagus machipongonensis]|uniref:Uracil phosphoribosyltransferase n=1 Tax=Algoriphagus machipongonensis TaxID=388413 RepID=A3I291_9BACT|nr:uracil phosphoribosyltransferase [Algoriphagus machipongonensis]EAZ79495.1 uracil phosphoribosyltransferase [Algoriphagus machipongonensis]
MFILSQNTSVANQFLLELRDKELQKDRMRFRKNLERLGEVLAYEISKDMDFTQVEVESPLEKTKEYSLISQPVIISVLRASLPFYQGFLNFFDKAESGFIGAFREEDSNENEVSIKLGYHASPSLEGKEIIIADPMLATGKSIIKTIETLLTHGKPKKIHIAAAFAAPEGIAHIQNNLKEIPYSLWLGTLDEKLNKLFYIVPGLGDAGDLAFGPKL